MAEFEVRLFSASQKTFETILIDAKSEKAALPLAAGLAKKHGADFFELRRRSAGCAVTESARDLRTSRKPCFTGILALLTWAVHGRMICRLP